MSNIKARLESKAKHWDNKTRQSQWRKLRQYGKKIEHYGLIGTISSFKIIT